MPVKKVRTSTAGQKTSFLDTSHLSKEKLPKSLLTPKRKITGRNTYGHITVRHRGGGQKRHYRLVDFSRLEKVGITAKVDSFHFDPNRTAYLALLVYADGDKRLMLAPKGLEIGDEVVCDEQAKIKVGNRMMLKNIPVGYSIYNLELKAKCGGKIVRSAGASAKLVGLDGDMAQVELPSREVRKFHKNCYATIGIVGNEDHSLVRIGKAGRMRRLGRRPQVLGKSMNPCDHPHGGGEGHSPIGMKAPRTPWGAVALGKKTRKKKNPSNKFIVKRRKKKK